MYSFLKKYVAERKYRIPPLICILVHTIDAYQDVTILAWRTHQYRLMSLNSSLFCTLENIKESLYRFCSYVPLVIHIFVHCHPTHLPPPVHKFSRLCRFSGRCHHRRKQQSKYLTDPKVCIISMNRILQVFSVQRFWQVWVLFDWFCDLWWWN